MAGTIIFFSFFFFIFFSQYYILYRRATAIKEAIATVPHFYIKNVKTTMEGSTKVSARIRSLTSDVIIMDKTIILITYTTFFNTPTMRQPCLQFFFDENTTQKIDGVSYIIDDTFIQFYGTKLFLKGNTKTFFLNAIIECSLKINTKDTDILAILKQYNITVYP